MVGLLERSGIGELGSVSPASTFMLVVQLHVVRRGHGDLFFILHSVYWLTVVQNFSSTGMTQIICLLYCLVLYGYKLVAISLDTNGCSTLLFTTQLYIK